MMKKTGLFLVACVFAIINMDFSIAQDSKTFVPSDPGTSHNNDSASDFGVGSDNNGGDDPYSGYNATDPGSDLNSDSASDQGVGTDNGGGNSSP